MNYNYYNNNPNGYMPNNNYGNYNMYQPTPLNVQQQTPQQIQTRNGVTYGFAFVNGMEEARTYIVEPNKTMYLKDYSSNLLFEKKADNQGRYTIECYTLTKSNEENNEIVKRSEFELLASKVNTLLENLEKSQKSQKNGQKSQNNYN